LERPAVHAPIWIAHRGYPTRYPENTLVGFRASIEAGATWLETDIQLSRDAEPMLYHDETLDRVSGTTGSIFDHAAADLARIPASCASQFGDRYADERIATLGALAELLRDAPRVQVMVELKEHSIERFGVVTMVDRVWDRLAPVADQVVLISFDLESLRYARRTHGVRIGWVLPAWDDGVEARAREVVPEHLVVDRQLLPPSPEPPWEGRWTWAVYSIDQPEAIGPVVAQGIQYLETNCIGEMIARP
jgi:glycerophosphoryl diester phosphodiesterase